jgi:hypothetical protein
MDIKTIKRIYQWVKNDIMENVIKENTAKADMTTNRSMKKFYEDLSFATEHEISLYELLNMPSTMFELKTIKYAEWSEYNNILIEVWKHKPHNEEGSLMQTEATWWVHELIQPDGLSQYHLINVNSLKQRYNTLKDDVSNFVRCNNEDTGEKTWCMPIQIINTHTVELDKMIQQRDYYKNKYEEFLNEKK